METKFYFRCLIEHDYLNIQILPVIMVEREGNNFSIVIGWLVFAFMVDFNKK
jgi:hypothetical protein